jgi:hypothetical protein
MYHGILINNQFINEDYPTNFKIFASKQDDDWTIYGVEINDEELDTIIKDIQINIRLNEPWYCHFYNDDELIIVFKEKIFKVSPHISTWKEIFDYAKTLNIPEHQLDFWPNRFQDERHYFNMGS